ncbi:MAG: thioredoxin domain-containing protein [Chloroflexi bacterium]|jgi:protein-disulfide isomerase|nr:DsbA family protein [Anaerolineaceae bacterium]NLI45352.1 thioredoxin domain-containing protein [Chloroflexota bacterium]HOE34574.1 thioredoxin domain-containing protein [Anaerolineaceae bacterium]HOT25012.1 thioredoxin domain-containing protein [Anaerolineaceae bacterium]HQH57664.1 thioredoxin domain-containing protein [Anaerolineaceae bacterium]
MTGTQTQRDILRQKRKQAANKKTITILAVVGGVALVVFLLVMLPKWTLDTGQLYMQDGFSIGDPNAPVKVEQFSDFRCSHCQNFALNYEDDFIKKYVDTGMVYFTFHNYAFLSEDSRDAAEASYCAAEQNAFWQYKKLLYTYSTYAGAFAESNLLDYAKKLKLDTDKFSECLKSDRNLAKLDEIMRYANSLGIDSTPQFSVNGTIVYMNTLNETVDKALLR